MTVLPITITKKDRIAIIAPHPDDECIGVGGIIALYPKLCDVYILTDGSRGGKNVSVDVEKEIRYTQFIKEMGYAQVHNYFWLGYEDGALMGKSNCMDMIDFSQYTKIFIPCGDDNHPDHTATYIYAVERAKQQGVCYSEIYQYEVHVPFHDVTHFVDISQVIHEKKKLIQFHEDQVGYVHYDEIAVSLAKYRACQANQTDKYFETFVKVDIYNEVLSNEVKEREELIQKYRQFYRLFYKWIRLNQNRKSIAKHLQEKKINLVTIYGYGDVGKLLYGDLLSTDIEVKEILDKREIVTQSHSKNLKVYKPREGNTAVDAIIVTAIYYFDEIEKELMDLGYQNIISLQRLLEEIDEL